MSFSEEQVAFRDNVRRMVARHVAPIAAEIDETDRFPLELVKLFGEMGLMQLWVPERYDGPNGNLTMACIAREEISKVSPACASIAALNTMFIMPLLHFGSEEQRRRYLPIIAKGGVVTAIAIIIATASAAAVQLWFRAQAKRSQFRRRQTSSRIATFAEAFSSIGWAATAALALTIPVVALASGILTLLTLAIAWKISPRQA